MTAFILKGRKRLPPDDPPSSRQTYDPQQQLWIDTNSGVPVVNCMRGETDPTRFGETLLTATREGADQAEGSALQASTYGETTITKTSEGADQYDVASLDVSNYGETTLTRTYEGANQTEATDANVPTGGISYKDTAPLKPSLVSIHASYSHF